MSFKNKLFSEYLGEQIQVMSYDNISILPLFYNVRKSDTTAKFYRKNRKKNIVLIAVKDFFYHVNII